MEIFPKKLGNACIKKGPDGDVTPRRNLSHIIGNDKNLSFRDS